MLNALSVRNIVLIDQLDLALDGGMTVLTGETGAGKSILLDALTLALGGRGDASLVRSGQESGQVVAVLQLAADHPALQVRFEVFDRLVDIVSFEFWEQDLGIAPFLRTFFEARAVPAFIGQAPGLQGLVYGLVLIGFVLFEPLGTALHRLPLPGRVASAILGNTGPYAPWLQVASALESGSTRVIREVCKAHNIEADEVNRALLRALAGA